MTATLQPGTRPVSDRAAERRTPAGLAWGAAVLLAAAALVVDRFQPLPVQVASGVAGLLGVLLVLGLVVRTGGRPALPVLLAAAWVVAAVVTGQPLLLGGAAVGVGIAGATLAVMGTAPAARFREAIREVVLACIVATVAGLGVAAFGRAGGVAVDRFTYLVLAAALLGCFVLVHRLGAGFHGLGRRGYAVAAGATALLAIALAYSAAVGRWGSPALIGSLGDVRTFVRAHAGAVPHPIETLLGVPALCWGTFMRARRRQGWWVCAFGAAVTAPATTRFLLTDVSVRATVLGAVYSLVLGLALGFLVVRVEQRLTGSRGRRARRDEEAGADRAEPGRLQPLQ